MLLQKIRALILALLIACLSTPVQARTHATDILIPVERFTLIGEWPLDRAMATQWLEQHTGKQHSLSSLQTVVSALNAHIRAQGFTFYRIFLPKQPLGNGNITLTSVAFTLGQIEIQGNRFYDDDNLRQSLPSLIEGASPNTEQLAADLKVAAHHPRKDLRLLFKQSKTPDQVDAVVKVQDAKADHINFSLSNTGSDDTGDYRFTSSYQHANLWQQDHILNLSLTTSPDHLKEVRQYGGSYALPWYAQGAWLTAYAFRSDVDTGIVAEVFEVSGAGTTLGLHYLQHIPRLGSWEHWLDLGLDSRLFENDIQLNKVQLGTDVRSAPISVLYKAEYPWQSLNLSAYVQLHLNTGWGSDNNAKTYAASRVNADQYWGRLNIGVNARKRYLGWVYQSQFAAQYTPDALISGEQFGLGGSTSIRGYKEREISTDIGVSLTLEATSPTYYHMNLAGFIDYGWGQQQDVQLGDPFKSIHIAAIGLGLRWQYTPLLVRLDLAHALNPGIDTQAGDNRVHGVVSLHF